MSKSVGDTVGSDSVKTSSYNWKIWGICLGVVAIIVAVGLILVNTMNETDIDTGEGETILDGAISGLTDEQKKKMGATAIELETTDDEDEHEEQEKYTQEYKEYLELPEREKAKTEVVPRKYEVPEEMIEIIKAQYDDEETVELPEKFDLRDVIEVPVGNQGKYDICWTFATGTALATHLALRGAEYDPAEMQVNFLASNLMYNKDRRLHAAGSFDAYKDIAMSIGTMQESDYQDLSIKADDEFWPKSKNFDYLKLAKNDNPVYITETVDFPVLRKSDGQILDKTEDEVAEFRDLVKAHIMKNGALYTAIASPHDDGLRYCAESGPGCQQNHAVAIIGWDDNYARENFGKVDSEGKRQAEPAVHDGAYLALNSWGEEWNSESGEKGVYYISYDDYAVEKFLSGIVSTSFDDAKKLQEIQPPRVREAMVDALKFYVIEDNGEEYLTKYALTQLVDLDLSGRKLNDADLEELVNFLADEASNLKTIKLDDNSLTSLNSLANLSNLKTVSARNNQIREVADLGKLEALERVDLAYNEVQDLGDLASNRSLVELDLAGNIGVSGLNELEGLEFLNLDETGLEDFESLNEAKNINIISARNNKLQELRTLPTTLGVVRLDVTGNQLVDLATMATVETINVSNNSLENAEILNTAMAMQIIATGNKFTDLSRVANNTIQSLDLSENRAELQNVGSLEKLENLKSLSLRDCKIKGVDELGAQMQLRELDLSGNSLTSLAGIEKMTNLESLKIENNNLTSLDGVGELKKMVAFYADNNKLSEAKELLKLERLNFVALNGNQFKEIPKFTKQSILSLAIASNPLEVAKVPSAVVSINLQDCGLKDVDFSDSKGFEYLAIGGERDWRDTKKIITKALVRAKTSHSNKMSINVAGLTTEEFGELQEIVGVAPKNVAWGMMLDEYGVAVKKNTNNLIDLEQYPELRAILINNMKDGLNQNNLKVDREALSLTWDQTGATDVQLKKKLSLEPSARILTKKIEFMKK